MRILGIDPGSQITGYGLIELQGTQNHYLTCGCIRSPSGQPLPQRLQTIFSGVQELIQAHSPDEMAIEQVFMHRNADAALKLGQARGVAICAGALAAVPISEYAPRAIKQAVVGRGGAAKEQVQHMVRALLQLSTVPAADAADALAVALCHGHTQLTQQRTGLPLAALRRRR